MRDHGHERFDVNLRGVPEGGAWLIVAEQWHPGWRATVDGVETEIVRADDALRAIRVPGGDSLVRMSYRPTAEARAVWLALAAALALLAWGRFASRAGGRAA